MPLSRRWFLAGMGMPAWSAGFNSDGIRFETIRNGSSRRRYLHIHGDEETARAVLRDHMKSHAGIANVIVSDKRLLPFQGGELDPNRMFSRDGARRNLRRLNRGWDERRIERALDVLDKIRGGIVKRILPARGGLLVALHNNSGGYNVNVEVPISDETALNEPSRPHEFFLATDPGDFRILAKSPYNVVLQNRAPTEDDGSCSRLAAARGVRYVNLEVTLGETERQRQMLEWLERNLP